MIGYIVYKRFNVCEVGSIDKLIKKFMDCKYSIMSFLLQPIIIIMKMLSSITTVRIVLVDLD